VPLPTIRRLPGYLRFLRTLKARGREVVSCTHIADELTLTSIQVRKDLALTGIVGKPRVGYDVPELIDAIEEFLGWKNTSDAFLVGAGSLGRALLGYDGFQEAGLNLVAAFDVDTAKIGTQIHGREVLALERMHDLAMRMHVLIGVLTVPAAAAQDVATMMVMAGMRAIWNYTPVKLEVPDNVIVEDVKLTSSLAVLCSRLGDLLRSEATRRRRPAAASGKR
jgi:redox-sensing transcriptional repressor